jgi:rhamnosyltransferase
VSAPRKVFAVIAAFNPDLDRLARVIQAVSGQAAHVVVVDDASTERSPTGLGAAVTLIELPANAGLAAALNRGAKAALEQGATHLLFLDQDSVAPAELVERLLQELDGQAPVAAVGPAWSDERTGRRGGRAGQTSFLIMSGMLVPAPVFEKLGGFDETLGVDSVDREWCFRALAAGYCLLQVTDVALDHRIGDAPLRGGWTRHRPERLYSMMRNRVLLYRRGYVPWRWKVVDVVRAAGKLVMFSVFFAPRGQNLRQMLRGLRDGAQMRRR